MMKFFEISLILLCAPAVIRPILPADCRPRWQRISHVSGLPDHPVHGHPGGRAVGAHCQTEDLFLFCKAVFSKP